MGDEAKIIAESAYSQVNEALLGHSVEHLGDAVLPIHLCRIAMRGRVIRNAIDLLQAGEAIDQAPNSAAIRP